ncbi:TRAP transporter small permease [Fictibacillus enclensis]|uniref:TRAP transporter small permease n=1 Tax=Fictibacillus enclensis TaxID=1017270 RepID=UPI0024C099EB|nr:TRAP transporter small permease [Fictibacillus enclensis]WHY71977.1 TRAP transporter small permease [Fictibacillus enclensis]
MVFVKWVDKLNQVLEKLLGLVLAVMTLVVFYQVMVRFVLTSFGGQFSAPWTEELARYLMIWLVFIGGAVAARKANSLAVEILIQSVPPLVGRLVKVGSHIASLIFYAFIFVIGLVWIQFGLSETSPVMKVSMSYIYAAMSVGSGLMILNTITILVDAYVNKKDILEVIDVEVEEALADYKTNRKETAV